MDAERPKRFPEDEGIDRNEWYRQHCGHSTDPVETSRRDMAAEKALFEKYPGLRSPFVADRYGGEMKSVDKSRLHSI